MTRRIRPGGPFLVNPQLTDGDDRTLKRASIVMPTPFRRQNGVIDAMPSLLLSTLAATAVAIPIGQRSTDVAPRVPQKIQVQVEQDPNVIGQLLPTFMPIANGNAAIVSEQTKQHYAVTFEHPPNLLRKLLPDFLPVGQHVYDSAPPPEAPVYLEIPRALIRLPLPDFLPLGLRASDSAPITKYAVECENVQSQLTTGIPAAAVVPIPPGAQVGDSSPPKYAVQVEQYPTLIRVTLPDFGPPGQQLQDHETKPRYEVTALATPNLTLTTLLPPAGPLPIGQQVSDSAWTAYEHSVTQIDDFQSLLALNPPPPPVIPTPTIVDEQFSGGWEKRRWFYTEYERELKRRIDEEKRRLAALEAVEEIDEPISREIGKLLQKQEAIDAERTELERLRVLVRQSGRTPSPELTERVQQAYIRAYLQQNFSALQALDRELRRAMEEEEIAALMILLNED